MDNVQYIAQEQRLLPYTILDSFSYSPNRGWKWLQRLCFWVLRKLHCHTPDHMVEIERIPIGGQTVGEKLMRQIDNLRHFYYEEADTVILGAKDYAELMGCPETSRMIEFEQPVQIGGRYGIRVIGLSIVVVPWMEGIVVMPKSKGRISTKH